MEIIKKIKRKCWKGLEAEAFTRSPPKINKICKDVT